MPFPQLYYEHLVKLSKGELIAFPEIECFVSSFSNDYVFFAYEGNVKPLSKRIDAGWKFFVSVDDTVEANLARAWNIVVDILVEHQISQSKVIRGDIHLSEGDPAEGDMDLKFAERGKQIVIYAYDDDLGKPWATILHRISQGLVDAAIQPSYFPPYNRPMAGSYYLSYRNDANKSGKKYSANHRDKARKDMRDKGYNPHGHPDIFEKLSLTIDLRGKEIVIPKWKEDARHYCEKNSYEENKMVGILMGVGQWSASEKAGRRAEDEGVSASGGATSSFDPQV